MKKLSNELVTLAANIYKEYGTGGAVEKKLDVSHTTAYRLLHRAGIVLPKRDETKPCRIKVKGEIAKAVASDYNSGMSWDELEKKYGFGQYAMREAVRRMGMPIKDHGAQRRRIYSHEEKEICRLYTQEHFSQAQIAVMLKSGQSVISRVLRNNGIHSGMKSGENHGSWKGGRSVTSHGYVYVMDKTYPSMLTRVGYVPEHRLNMAKYLGRPLEKWESVHHIDGNRSNNEISNLQLRIGQHGAGSVYCCSECGSLKIRPIQL